MALRNEFDRQVENLLRKGYPEFSGMGPEAFVQHVVPLADRLPGLRAGGGDSFLPFAIVVTNEAVAAERAIPLLELRGKPGFTSMEAGDLARFGPIDGIDIPRGPAYLVSGIDSGEATLNVTPDDALETIVRDKRSPLTIDEGLALITHFPEVLETRNSFSMLGSRCGDRRVTAIWISRGAPRLGWCWAGNPHTWLGSASCMGRIGA
jgi:uncharacterized protein DUF5701